MKSALVLAASAVACSGSASAEPHFLTSQHARCAACHYNPTGGGLLTPYGRMLSKEYLSSFGASPEAAEAQGWPEESFLFGLVRELPWGLDLGLDLRPSRLRFDFGGEPFTRRFLMRADLEVALRHGPWTAYAELGRLPGDDPSFISREHWVQFQSEDGIAIRAGRFLPPFGLRHADHTSFNRRPLGFDQDDQIYGVEIAEVGEGHLYQVYAGPGRAESLLDDDGLAAWTLGGRLQWELGSRNVLTLSGLFRGARRRAPSSGLGGVAWGIAGEGWTAWSELDARASKGWKGTPEYVLFHQFALKVVKGLWVKLSPQLITELGDVSGGSSRLSLGVQFLPRPHWNVLVDWTRQRDRPSGAVFKTLVLQLHLYL